MGELFDRSIAIYVRHFKVFAAMMLVLLVPYGIVRYFVIPDQAVIARMLEQTQHAGATVPPTFIALLQGFAYLFALLLLVSPFVSGAIAIAVNAINRGESPSFENDFRAAFSRGASILGTLLVNLLVFGGVYILGIVVLSVLFGVGIALVKSALPVATVAFIFGGVATIVYLAALLVVAIAWAFGSYACAVENIGPIEAVSRSYARVFARSEIGRALVVMLALVVLELGVAVLVGIAVLLVQLVTKNYFAVIVVDTLITAVFGGYFPVAIAVYYFDVRKRTEALDIESALAGHADAIAAITANEPVYAATAYVSGDERAIIKYFLERRETLGAERRASLAAQLANRVRDRVPVDMRTLENEALLERL